MEGIGLMILEGKSLAEVYQPSSDIFDRSLPITVRSPPGILYDIIEDCQTEYVRKYFDWMARQNHQRAHKLI